ncbi:hypothetical protein Tco_1229898 [Tanacetum coccineum]
MHLETKRVVKSDPGGRFSPRSSTHWTIDLSRAAVRFLRWNLFVDNAQSKAKTKEGRRKAKYAEREKQAELRSILGNSSFACTDMRLKEQHQLQTQIRILPIESNNSLVWGNEHLLTLLPGNVIWTNIIKSKVLK